MKRHTMEVPAFRVVLAVLAGELAAYALSGAAPLQEPPRFALSLATGAVSGFFLFHGVPAAARKGGRCRQLSQKAEKIQLKKPEKEPPQEEFLDVKSRAQAQRLQAAAELAAQLEADARRLLVRETAQQKERPAHMQALDGRLQSAREETEAALQAVQRLKGRFQDRTAQNGRELAGEYGAAAQQLEQAAFQANLLALHLQRMNENGAQAAAQGLRLLAARCCRCGGQLCRCLKGSAAFDGGELEELIRETEKRAQQALWTLQKEEAAEPDAACGLPEEKQFLLPKNSSAQLAAQAHALLKLLKDGEQQAEEKEEREGMIEGTALYYRRLE